MTYSRIWIKPARTTTARIPRILVGSLLIVIAFIAATAATLGYPLPGQDGPTITTRGEIHE